MELDPDFIGDSAKVCRDAFADGKVGAVEHKFTGNGGESSP
ncbi:MAG: hypothetical protein ACU83U_07560 [Gammaproteobacteria bacterium]